MSSRPDVVIVGAGLIGCASAYSLARRGLRVTLVESGDLASGASGACDGHICCQSKAPGLHLTLAQRSSLAYETLSEELGEDTGYCRCGSWLIAGTPEELTALARCTPGLPVSVHDADEVRRAEPILGEAVRGGRFCPTDGQTDPWLTTLAFCHAARRLGAHVELGVEVTSIRVNSGHAVGVDTVSGPLTSGAVLLAAGAWTAPLCSGLGIRLPLRPRRGEILVTEPMPSLLSSVILHAPYVASKFDHEEERSASLVLEQTALGNVLLGSTRSFVGFDARSSADGIEAVAREAARLAPALADLHLIRAFAGLRPCSGDGLPLVGPVGGIEGLFVATGHEGDGVALAPVTGEIVAAALAGEDAWFPELLPDRRPPVEQALDAG